MISKDTRKEVILRLVKNTCRACGHCCTLGSGIVLKHEVKELADAFNMTEKEFIEKYLDEFTKFNTTHYRFKQIKDRYPSGRCIFYDTETKKCKIHEIKPLHCRISTCALIGSDIQKWFDVNYFLNTKDINSIREYEIYSRFNEPFPGLEPEKLINEVNQNGRKIPINKQGNRN